MDRHNLQDSPVVQASPAEPPNLSFFAFGGCLVLVSRWEQFATVVIQLYSHSRTLGEHNECVIPEVDLNRLCSIVWER